MQWFRVYAVVFALMLVGCGGGSSSMPGTHGPGSPGSFPNSLPKTLYVFEGLLPSGVGELDVFPAGSSGTVTPIKLASAYLYPDGGALALAPTGSLYATGYTDKGYLVVSFSPAQLAGGGGNPTPIIYSYYYYIAHGGNPKELLIIGSLAVDSKGDVFVIGEPNGVIGKLSTFEYPAGFTPTTTPVNITTAAETSPTLVYVDANDNLYVANGSTGGPFSIFVYSSSSPTGTPIRTIAGSNVGFQTVSSLAVTPNGSLIVFDGVTDEVYVFAPNANGNVAPQAVFQSGELNWASPVTADANGNVYGSQWIIASNTFQIQAFASNSIGVVTPLFSVQSPTLYPTFMLFSH